ncbi:VENN motif pre-toxin domain-containing protein [Thermopetrobacter sp. TC1]|uniref:VENN motif pre-toxin domain-containing protein n=1 Tax=Thermopetrobacter sp. TC1 TaxID=1495045 RepID=UPI0035107A37
MGGTFEAGAAAALSSAMAANAGLFSGLDPRTLDAVSQLIGGAAALLAGGDAEDVNQGATIARSAAFNNYLTHEEIRKFERDLKACKKDIKCKASLFQFYQALSKRHSQELKACGLDNLCVAEHLLRIAQAVETAEEFNKNAPLHPWLRDNLNLIQTADFRRAVAMFRYNHHLQEVCPGLEASCVQREKLKDNAKTIGDFALDVTPVIGDIKAFYEAWKSGDPVMWVAAVAGIVPGAGDALSKELKLLRLAKAGKLKGLSRAAFDKLPEVAHLSKAERDQAFLRFVLGDDVRSWNRFQSSTKGFYASREETAKAWEEYKRIHSIKTAAQRNRAAKKFFLRQLAASGKAPKWMNQWLIKGKVSPGYEVDHIKPLSIGGEDSPLNMRLLDIKTHREWHTIYSPWRNPK